MSLWWVVGLIVLGSVTLVAQQMFYRTHRAMYGHWRPLPDRVPRGPNAPERRAMVQATFARADDPKVEKTRHRYLVIAAVTLVYAVVGLATGVAFSR